jgi:hypothetical protein
MPSLVSDNFRIFASQQFIESLEEPYNSSSNPSSEDSGANPTEAAASQAYRSKIYLFIGRSYNWNDTTANAIGEKYAGVSTVSDFSPPNPVDSLDELSEIYDDMIAVKRVTRSDVSEVIRKRVWQPGVVYDMYKHDYGTITNNVVKLSATGQSKLYDSQFYVMNKDFQVYKCIYNGQDPDVNQNGIVSTVEPTGTSTSIFTTSDGYKWKYMYTISISDYIKFVSSDFIPVRKDTSVQNAAVDGAIHQILISNRGTGLTNGIYYTPVVGDGTSNCVVKITVSSLNSSSRITAVEVENNYVGAGYTYGTIDLSKCYTSAANANTRSGTEISPGGAGANLEVIISPPGGHGSNAIHELGGYRVMINKSLDFLDGNGDIPINMQFRRFGLIEDPQVGNLDFTAPTATVCRAIKFDANSTADFQNGEIIEQNITEARGRVIHWDSVNKILRYYQNEYISATQEGDYNKNKFIAFSGNYSVVGRTSGVSLQPLTSFSTSPGTVLSGTAFENGYSSSEIKKYSGKILYVENRKPVFRSNDQIEDIKLVIEF